MAPNVFAVPVFFICFRECLETVVIVSVLLAFLKQSVGPDRDPVVYKKLRRQVWIGVFSGVFICLAVGGGLIGAFYGFGKDHFATAADIWEGSFALVASIIITLIGAPLLRVSKMQAKWRVKLARAIEKNDQLGTTSRAGRFKHFCQKYAMFVLPFVTVMREGLEAVVFIAGVGLGLPATSFPLAVVCGFAAGVLVGYIIYRFGNSIGLQIFLIVATCFLYLVAAGLFSRAVWLFENHAWSKIVGGDVAEAGSGPGSYDIRKSVWHVNCCNPEIGGGGGWGIFNALLGWQNSATYGSVISYNIYWLVVIFGFLSLIFFERKGHWPFMKAKVMDGPKNTSASDDSSGHEGVLETEKGLEAASVSTKPVGTKEA